MWHRVDLVWTEVSEESIASIFRVENPRARNQREQVAANLRGTFRKTTFYPDIRVEVKTQGRCHLARKFDCVNKSLLMKSYCFYRRK
jgi:hypothetical protein